jgi:hypothetical protein
MATLRSLADALSTDGFSFVASSDFLGLLKEFGRLQDWPAFADSWNDLRVDPYMADGGRYRKRRHAAFAIRGKEITRLAAQSHYQSIEHNRLNGGIERWFEPIAAASGTGSVLTSVLLLCRRTFEMVAPAVDWHVEVHQFRIQATSGGTAKPTPEGVHRDGVDYVLVLLVNRKNIVSGVTSVHDLSGAELGRFTLTQPFDAAFVDDARLMHGVTPIEPLDATNLSFRDVLVVTFRRI